MQQGGTGSSSREGTQCRGIAGSMGGGTCCSGEVQGVQVVQCEGMRSSNKGTHHVVGGTQCSGGMESL